MLPIFIFFFWAYNVIDAVRKTSAFNRILAGGKLDPLPDENVSPELKGSVPTGVFLIIAGLAALSYTAFGMSLQWLEEWWPIAPVLFGAYLIYLDRVEKKGV